MTEIEVLNDELNADFQRGETIFAALLDERRTPTYGESVFLRRIGIERPVDIEREVLRLERVRRLQGISGTIGSRELQAAELQAASDVLNKQRPKIQAKIDALNGELRSLENDEANAEKRLSQMHDAVRGLRENVPPYIRLDIQRQLAFLGSTIGARRGELRVRRDELQLLIERADVASADASDLKAELAELLVELASVEADFDSRCDDARAPFDFYVI